MSAAAPVRFAAALLVLALAVAGCSRPRVSPASLARTVTLAGEGFDLSGASLSDPFGIAVDGDETIYVGDGRGGAIRRIPTDGPPALVTDRLDMPSHLALAPDGTLVVADTGAHTIVRVDVETGATSVIAGAPGTSGDADGRGGEARFDAPIGVAVGPDGTVFVADSYNDRIRAVAADGSVRTIAGGPEPGFLDGPGADARFDTPCGIAVAPEGSLFVADTGNHRIRRILPDGTVTTFAGTGEAAERDGPASEAAFDEPTGIAFGGEQTLLVADGAGSSLRVCSFGEQPRVDTLVGQGGEGLADGDLATARLARPAGLAVTPSGVVVFADGGNNLVRACVPDRFGRGRQAAVDELLIPPGEIKRAVPPRWPFHPPSARREIAGTFGEIRGEKRPDREAWFHNGLDVPGRYGEIVRAIYTERVARPLPVADFGGPRERLRLPLVGYTHVRVGRDERDRPLGLDGVSFRLDASGAVTAVRVRRGARINAGDPIGSLNRLNHVHLIVGPPSAEVNALAALELPGLVDTISPVIERVTLTDSQGNPLGSYPQAKTRDPSRPPIPVAGPVRITVRAYDQLDGNAGYRRLGLYLLGYQVLGADGSPAPGFESARDTILFDRLARGAGAAGFAYADGSQSGYQGETVFDYIVTNYVRSGEARVEFWDPAALAPGAYTVRVHSEDFHGNRAIRDVPVVVTHRAE